MYLFKDGIYKINKLGLFLQTHVLPFDNTIREPVKYAVNVVGCSMIMKVIHFVFVFW